MDVDYASTVHFVTDRTSVIDARLLGERRCPLRIEIGGRQYHPFAGVAEFLSRTRLADEPSAEFGEVVIEAASVVHPHRFAEV
ncbi:hypothetical protein BRD01_00480, partial [Halobacteriales archaeon QS_8_65_32]